LVAKKEGGVLIKLTIKMGNGWVWWTSLTTEKSYLK
jgi:hypothetical protein